MFIKWLEKEIELRLVPYYVIIGVLICRAVVMLNCYLMYILNIQITQRPVDEIETLIRTSHGISEATAAFLITVFSLIFCSLIEEIFFRFPLSLPVKMGCSTKTILIVATVLSVIFGWLHSGFSHVPLQGVSGFIYSLLYLKCGGLQRKVYRAFMTSWSAHFLSNMILAIWMFFAIMASRG